MSYAVKPVCYHLSRHYGRRLADENKESSLEGILGVLMVEQSAADAPDHRPMPLDEGSEGSFVLTLDEIAKELPIGQSRSILHQHGPAKVLDDLARLGGRHMPPSAGVIARPLPIYLPHGGRLIQLFHCQNGLPQKTRAKQQPDTQGFIAVFSASYFPDAQIVMEWVRQDGCGNVYR